MTNDAPGGGGGPYQSDTDLNTASAWLDDIKPIEAKLDGMSDYANALMTIADQLHSHGARVTQQMSALELDAFLGGFPEVNYASTLHAQNVDEFNQYLYQLLSGLQHCGNAAQAIADSYGDKDGFSAISLNSVQFAFGEPGATRPSGLPSFYGETYSEAEAKAMAAAAKPGGKPPAHSDRIWTPTGTTTGANGDTTMTYADQYGETRSVSVTYGADGHKITTMTGPDGTTVSDEATTTLEFGTFTTTTTTGVDKKVTTDESDTTYAGNTATTETSSGGQLNSVTTVTDNADGSQTTSTYDVDDKGHRTLGQQVTVKDAPAVLSAPDTPDSDAMNVDNAVINGD